MMFMIRGSRSAVRSIAILRQKSALHDKRLRTCSTDHVGRSRDSTECQRHRISESAHLRSDSRTRPYGDYSRSRRNRPPSDDDGDDSGDSDDHGRRRDSVKRRNHRRRRHDPSPSDGSDDSDDGSPSDSSHKRTDAKIFRIQLQKFDGTGSWESWWAHFQNCSTYKWSRRDKLAFLKGALSGNASQVLWDTGRSTTDSLSKLIKVLKSRYGGERQAEKHKAELQVRRRKSGESLSELHQDIRRLMALAFPKLTAEAREEIACDHFTHALGDPDLALKVKERLPKSLDEALRIALQLEAWTQNVKWDQHEDDRVVDRAERPKQPNSASAKQDSATATDYKESKNRLTKLETQMTKLHEDLKKLTTTPESSATPPRSSQKPPTNPPVQRFGTQASSQAGEGSRPPFRSQPPSRSQPDLVFVG